MSDALRAAKQHLAELAANAVPAKDKPSALHHGLIQTLVNDLERALELGGRAVTLETKCEYCGKPSQGQRFDSEECRAAWHREHDPRGKVKTLRRLADGVTTVTVHFGEPDAERALRFVPGQDVVLGALP